MLLKLIVWSLLAYLLYRILRYYYTYVYPLVIAFKPITLLPRRFLLGNLLVFRKAIPPGMEMNRVFVQFFNGFFQMHRNRDIGCLWISWSPYIMLFRAETVEVILSSQNELKKSVNYKYLEPWLGTGLLTSTGNKWRSRRKLLTPAFHFKILDDFIPIFNEQSKILVKRLSKCPYIDDVVPYITTCTLDIICETAMGTKINAQKNPQSDYVKAIGFLGESFMVRNLRPSMWWTPMFKLWSYGQQYFRSLDVLHAFTRKVIEEKKREMMKRKSSTENAKNKAETDDIGIKKRQAFLDLLLEYNLDGAGLSEEDIREEVDTFMFEGHDTTSMGICWSLYLIGLDQKVQAKVHEELDSIFGDDRERPINIDDLANMKYLECCIKEALRLFPSVPLIGRKLQNDTVLAGYNIPRKTTVIVVTFALHRDPKYFPNPEVYNPDRFLPENSIGRNPYAYVPFSAGPRNCIGQKFALMEEKIVLASIFREFHATALDPREKISFVHELVTRPKVPMRFTFKSRFDK